MNQAVVKMKLKKGDLVAVIAGKDKGKQGKITEVILKDNKVVVEGVNIMKKHAKASQTNPQAGIISKQLGIHASNVMLVDPKSGKPTRVGRKSTKDGWVRVAKNSGTEIKEAMSASAKKSGAKSATSDKPASSATAKTAKAAAK